MSIDTFAISHDGKAIGQYNGKTWFIAHALPNETVEAVPLEQKKRVVFAKAKKIITPHEERIEPPCPQFAVCGGCDFQMANYHLQKEMKATILKDALTRLGNISEPVEAFHGAEKLYRYRNKGTFHLHHQNDQLQLSFYAPQTHQPIPARDCLLFSEKVNNTCKALEKILEPIDPQALQQLMIRENTAGELMITCIGRQPKGLPDHLLRDITALPHVKSVYFQTRGKNRHQGKLIHLAGERYLVEKIDGVEYQLSPASFFQVNHDQAEVLFQVVKRFLTQTGAKHLLDLYCGVGAIGLYLSDSVTSVLGIETVREAVKDAEANARRNHISNCRFVADRAETYLTSDLAQQYDVTVVDPPRSGLHESLINTIFTPYLIYVSCNPVTLARDLARLQTKGYRIQTIEAVDMFPQTAHVETVVLLAKDLL